MNDAVRKYLPKTTDEWVGAVVFLAAIVVGAFLRFDHLTAKPLHSDEGVNGWFLMNLYRGLHRTHGWLMNYKYDPTNYHGPFLYFAGLIPFFLFHPSVVTLRLLMAIAGTASIAILWPLRRWLGPAGLCMAAWLMAISPPFVFFSRTAIHEIYVWFFSLAAFVCLVNCYTGTGDANADAPRYRPNWLLFAAICLALIHANKETSVITWAAFVAAGTTAWFLAPGRGPLQARLKRLMALAPANSAEWSDYGLALAWAVAILVILYTSFFNNPHGAIDMVGTYFTWGPRGNQGAGHEKPFGYWEELLREFDAPILWMGLLGTLVVVASFFSPWIPLEWPKRRPLKASDRFSLFVLVWTWTLWLAYSVIHYKTPWCNLNFTGPACLLAGIAVRELVRLAKDNPGAKLGARFAPIAIPALVMLWPVPAGAVLGEEKPDPPKIVTWSKLTWDVNFVHNDDDRYKIVYVQTVRDFETLVDRVLTLFDKHDKKLTVWVTSGDYWPMPFYLRDYDDVVGYHQGKIPSGPPPNVVIASSSQEAELRDRLAGYRVEHYMLRPGVVLTMYVEPAIYDPVFGAPREDAKVTGPAPDPATLKPGLVGEYRYGVGCTGEVLSRRADPEPVYGDPNDPSVKEFRAPVCVTWTGWYQVEQEGDYVFTSRSDDGSWVWVDGDLMVDNGGAHGPIPRVGAVKHLTAGLHALEIRYFDAGGGAELKVTTHHPGDRDETSLRGHLLHDPHALTALASGG